MFNSLSHNSDTPLPPRKKAIENTMGKGENPGNPHFHLFSQCFLTYQSEESPL